MTDDAIPAGMVAWAGADAAPADWDAAGDMMMRDGTIVSGAEGEPFWDHGWGDADIIAYTPAPSIVTSSDERAREDAQVERLTRIIAECFSGMPERMAAQPIRCGDHHIGVLWTVAGDIAKKIIASGDRL